LLSFGAQGTSSGNRQQHIIRMLSSKVSQGSTSFEGSSVSRPLASTCSAGLGPAGCRILALSIASLERGVAALPYLSVCVIKSGTGSLGDATLGAPLGVFLAPGERRSLELLLPAGVDASGVDAAVRGVPGLSPPWMLLLLLLSALVSIFNPLLFEEDLRRREPRDSSLLILVPFPLPAVADEPPAAFLATIPEPPSG
jgi:hypothetical protein